MKKALSDSQKRRYARHIILPEVGVEGQKRLLASKVLCIGAGGLGSPVLMYLAAAGVGEIGIVEFDHVDETNLQRQIIHGNSYIGKPKGESAKARLKEINPECRVKWYDTTINKTNVMDLVGAYDVIVDGTDNFPTRYLVNDACVLSGKPNIYGSIFRFEGQASIFAPMLGGPCYRCLFPEPPPPGAVPSCEEGGVLGVLPGIIGSIQANETLKYLLNEGTLMLNKLLIFDAMRCDFRTINIRRDPNCAICGENPTQTDLVEYTGYCSLPHFSESPNEMDVEEGELSITVHEFKEIMDQNDPSLVVLDVREKQEYEICNIAGAHLIPLSNFRENSGHLKRDQTILVHCKSGKRSMEAVKQLRERGFRKSYSVEGGILAWAREFDSSIITY